MGAPIASDEEQHFAAHENCQVPALWTWMLASAEPAIDHITEVVVQVAI